MCRPSLHAPDFSRSIALRLVVVDQLRSNDSRQCCSSRDAGANGSTERGRPAGVLEDLDVVKQRPSVPARIIDPEPSTMRSPKDPIELRNGRKVGDPWPERVGVTKNTVTTNASAANDRTRPVNDGTRKTGRSSRARTHHTRLSSPPPIPDDSYVQTFFQEALGHAPSSEELTYWTDVLRAAYANGQGSMAIAVREMGKTLFESAEYAVRNPDQGPAPTSDCSGNPNNHCVYVYHLYKTYLNRNPDQPSWNNWASVVPTYGREAVRRGFDESVEFLNLTATVTPNGSASSGVTSLHAARVEPANQPRSGLVGAQWSGGPFG